MPRITAPTVREHHALVKTRLIDAAEEILHASGPQALTASQVAQRTGIARNSIYRYVPTVNDLLRLVIERRLKPWRQHVKAAVENIADPIEWLVIWTQANLIEAANSGHSWLMTIATSAPTAAAKQQAHREVEDEVEAAVARLGSHTTALHVAMVQGLLNAGFRRLAAGESSAIITPPTCAAMRTLATHIASS